MTSDDEETPHLALAESATWEHIGRDAVAGEVAGTRDDVSRAFHDIEETLRGDEPLDECEVRDARRALNHARRVLERHVATATDGTGAWGEPVPNMPYGVYRDVVER